jgi:uncharacterized protein (TIGR00369 family)
MAMIPFAVTLGMELVAASPEEVVGRLEWRDELCTTGGAMHGGALMSLADSVGGLVAYLNLPEGCSTSTTSSSTFFVRGLRAGTATATARPVHVGASTIVVETTITDDEGRTIARTTQSQAVLGPRQRDARANEPGRRQASE